MGCSARTGRCWTSRWHPTVVEPSWQDGGGRYAFVPVASPPTPSSNARAELPPWPLQVSPAPSPPLPPALRRRARWPARRHMPRSLPEASESDRARSPALRALLFRCDRENELILCHRRATWHVELLSPLEELILGCLCVGLDDVLAMFLG